MKFKTLKTLFALAALSTISHELSTACAQGSLTPPAGAPAPVMKSMDQIEARTPLEAGQPGVSVAANGAITITNSGSYYLTRNLVITNASLTAINVSIYDVTLDLNGFSVLCTNTNTAVSEASCISISGAVGQSVTIRNGILRGGGTNTVNGIYVVNTIGSVTVEGIHCYNNKHGIYLNIGEGRNVARNCSVDTAGFYGIAADLVSGCTVRNTLDDGIRGNVISDCYVVQSSTAADAIVGWPSGNGRSVVNNSIGRSKAGVGINADSVANSFGYSDTDVAISASTVINCTAHRLGGTAINSVVANGCYALSGTNSIGFKYNMP